MFSYRPHLSEICIKTYVKKHFVSFFVLKTTTSCHLSICFGKQVLLSNSNIEAKVTSKSELWKVREINLIAIRKVVIYLLWVEMLFGGYPR